MNKPQKTGLVPTIRFPEFQNEGEWDKRKIEKVCEKPFSGGTPSTTNKDYYGGDIPFIRSAEIDKEKTELFLTEEGLNNSAAKLVNKGDILIALYGANSGEVALGKIQGVINQAILCLRSKASNAFLYQYLSYEKERITTKYLQGGQGNLSGDIIKSIEFLFPNLEEQQKIADCLSSIDDLITAETQKLAALKTHKKGLMQQLFPAEGEAVPRLRFPEFRDGGDWEIKELRELATYTKGFAFKSQDYRSEGVRLIRVSDLAADFIKKDNDKVFIATESEGNHSRYEISKGEIIITTVGSKPEMIDSAVGRGIYVSASNEGLLNQNLLKLEVMTMVNSKFLFLSMNNKNYQSFITSISRGNANQANIAVKELMKFELKIPDYEEQQKIADCLSSVDALIAAQGEKVDALKLHKKGLMQQLFPVMEEVDV